MSASYRLIYWPSIPGRGEYVRLAFEYAGVSYEEENDIIQLQQHVMSSEHVGHPPHFAPPVLEISSKSGGKRYISQTPAILAYLAPQLQLDGTDPHQSAAEQAIARAQVNALTLTALDLSNETHDTHHPIAVSLTYEEQQQESSRRAQDFISNRLPKFFKYFSRVIESNKGKPFLYGSSITTADLVLFQVIDGLSFAFPKVMAALKADAAYDGVFGLHDAVAKQPRLSAYLQSSRRRPYSTGLFRHYPELDKV